MYIAATRFLSVLKATLCRCGLIKMQLPYLLHSWLPEILNCFNFLIFSISANVLDQSSLDQNSFLFESVTSGSGRDSWQFFQEFRLFPRVDSPFYNSNMNSVHFDASS